MNIVGCRFFSPNPPDIGLMDYGWLGILVIELMVWSLCTGDDIEEATLYGKPAHATHVYLPYIEGQKLLMSKSSPKNCPLLVLT